MSFSSQDDQTIYLDHAATTPVDAEVLSVMLPYFTETFGNPSSIYRIGQEGRAALDRARTSVATSLGCRPSEIIFTSGATESNNLALKGVAWHRRLANVRSSVPPHIVTTEIEHHAVLHAAESLARQGFAVTVVGCDREGLVDPAAVEAAIRPETGLISVMYANNEMGSDSADRGNRAIARRYRIPLHTDAVQAAGALPLMSMRRMSTCCRSSAHKVYGPKGVGVLYVRTGTPIAYQQEGGGQESGRRGGTENVPLIVGLAAALEKAELLRDAGNARAANLRDRLWAGIRETIPEALLNGPLDPQRRLANNLNLAIPGVQGETVLLGLDMHGIAASRLGLHHRQLRAEPRLARNGPVGRALPGKSSLLCRPRQYHRRD